KLVPASVDALLGKTRALTYLGRYEQALSVTDELLTGQWYIGDARYWRALNEAQLDRNDEAWDDVELAAKLLVNAEVPKLAGAIAYKGRDLETSRAKFEESRQRNPSDCEVGFYLQIVFADQGRWQRTAEVAPASAVCFDDQEAQLRRQIEDLRARTTTDRR